MSSSKEHLAFKIFDLKGFMLHQCLKQFLCENPESNQLTRAGWKSGGYPKANYKGLTWARQSKLDIFCTITWHSPQVLQNFSNLQAHTGQGKIQEGMFPPKLIWFLVQNGLCFHEEMLSNLWEEKQNFVTKEDLHHTVT